MISWYEQAHAPTPHSAGSGAFLPEYKELAAMGKKRTNSLPLDTIRRMTTSLCLLHFSRTASKLVIKPERCSEQSSPVDTVAWYVPDLAVSTFRFLQSRET
ncbi:hypothetical protein BN2475_340049 [Paraburkholderia ribeironis]|uniref:Uncharacterized protein n=1 Tax=Paraburkholderia ribeironis TaxID=1247936 RepID=A0A1N7S3M5_9BURK|nr:hypothetical protein BN2475_340049 [Paraburkholderia ribeironis]